jgi:hypothetical protein
VKKKQKRKQKCRNRYLKNKAIISLISNQLSVIEAESKIVFLSKLMNNQKYLNFYNAYKK